MKSINPTQCTVCLPWGFSEASDSARKKHCQVCAGTGLVYSIPPTHVVVPAEPSSAMIDAGVAMALQVSVEGEGGWSKYIEALYKQLISAATQPK